MINSGPSKLKKEIIKMMLRQFQATATRMAKFSKPMQTMMPIITQQQNCTPFFNRQFRNFSLINTDGSDITGGKDSSEAAAKASAKEFIKAVEEDLIIDEITTV